MAAGFQWIRDQAIRLAKTDRVLEEIKINQGRMLALQQRSVQFARLADYEFKVFSQQGEDGILQFLTSSLAIPNKTFIEFGVEDFLESNCRFLMMKDYWSGFIIDGSQRNIDRLKSSYFYWRYDLNAKAAFVTRETAAALLDESGFDKNVGILSVDIDGVDYHVLSTLGAWNPCILIVEYNALYGRERAVTVPYAPDFQRTKKHYSNLYWGASLRAFEHLLAPRGLVFVGTNDAANNAFFVRRDLLNDRVREASIADAPASTRFREARNEKGELSFVPAGERRRVIADMPLIDVVTGAELRVSDLAD